MLRNWLVGQSARIASQPTIDHVPQRVVTPLFSIHPANKQTNKQTSKQASNIETTGYSELTKQPTTFLQTDNGVTTVASQQSQLQTDSGDLCLCLLLNSPSFKQILVIYAYACPPVCLSVCLSLLAYPSVSLPVSLCLPT